MKRGFVVAVGGVAIVIAGLSGCSSDDKKSETSGATSSAAAAEGKTTVTIDGTDQTVQGHRRVHLHGRQREHRHR